MNTKSEKFERYTIVSHKDPAPSTSNDGNSSGNGAQNDTTNSGKIDTGSIIETGINGISDVLQAWLKKTPDTVINNHPEPTDNTPIYVGIGAGALILIVLVLVILKK